MKDIFISPNVSIKEALKKFNDIGEKVLIVVDENKTLLGTITDGDIRRYLLKTGSFEGNISNVYNRNPKFIYSTDSPEKAKKLMLDNKIEILPVVNNQKEVVGYITWYDLFKEQPDFYQIKEKIDIPVVIMAGGRGTRLDPFTRVLPKPLLPIKEKTITEHIIDSFKKFGFYRFILILNYKGKVIESYFNSIEKDYIIEFLWEDDFYGTAGGLYLLKDINSENFFVSNCDILLKVNYLDVLKVHQNQNVDFTTITCIKNYKVPYGVIETIQNNLVGNISEKPELVFQVNTGVYLVNKKILNYIPEKKYVDMPNLINELVKSGLKVLAYPISGSDYLDFGQWEEYREALKLLDGF
jgi:dTDP-glucose pyrophosphorylase/predicted transcriptional regulator